MRLFIAEKPKVNKAIAEFWARKKGIEVRTISKNVFSVGDDFFIPLSGHTLRLLDLKEYNDFEDFSWKQLERLPYIPSPFKKGINFDMKDGKRSFERYEGILSSVEHYLARADEVVNVGDPDDEGQYLVDEVIEYFNYHGKVSRLWTSGLTDSYLEKSFANITDNDLYFSKGLAAKARAESDWIFGINLTILFSSILGAVNKMPTPKGVKQARTIDVYSVGRVQTPVLNLIYEREQEHTNFVPKDFYTLNGLVSKDNKEMKVTFDLKNEGIVNELKGKDALNESGQLISREVAMDIVNQFFLGRKYPVSKAETTNKSESAPLALSLSELLKECGKRFDLNVERVQQIASDLYLAGYITYPRNKDCRHLTSGDFEFVPDIVNSLRGLEGLNGITDKTFDLVDVTYKGSKVWNDKEVEKAAHPAIVPTGELDSMAKFNALSEEHQNVFAVVAQYYLYQLMKPATFKAFSGVINHDKVSYYKLNLTGKQWIDRSWKDAYNTTSDKEADDDDNALPALQLNDEVELTAFDLNARKTTRPPLFNDVSLLDAMINAAKFVKNKELRSILDGKSNANSDEYSIPSGIGTDSTRANIISTLKDRNLVSVDKGFFRVTEKGRTILKYAPNEMKWVDTTAEWQQKFDDLRNMSAEDLENYKLGYNALMNSQKMTLKSLFSDAKTHLINKTGYVEEQSIDTGKTCPSCGEGHIFERKFMYNGEPRNVLSCNKCETKFKQFGDELVETFSRLTEHECKKCGSKLKENKGRTASGKDYHFFKCSNESCNDMYSVDKDGLPTQESRFPLTEHKCQKCNTALRHVEMDKKLEDGTLKHINMFVCDNKSCETLYGVKEDGTPKYIEYLPEPCPYCGSKVEHIKGVNKEGKAYNFGKCTNQKCESGQKPLSLNANNGFKIRKVNKPCPNCGKDKIIYNPFPKKDDPTHIYHRYECLSCKMNYWGDEKDFKNPFEQSVNSYGHTEKLLKDKCLKCKKGHIKQVLYKADVAAEKGRAGYYRCNDKNCGAFHEATDNGFKLSEIKKKD